MFIFTVYSVFNTDSDGTLLAVVVVVAVVLVVVMVVVIGVVVVVLNLPHLPKNRDTHFPCRRTWLFLHFFLLFFKSFRNVVVRILVQPWTPSSSRKGRWAEGQGFSLQINFGFTKLRYIFCIVNSESLLRVGRQTMRGSLLQTRPFIRHVSNDWQGNIFLRPHLNISLKV